MQAISIGPLVFATDRFAVIIGITVFLLAGSLLASRLEPRLVRWSSWALALGLLGARLWHVAIHIHTFALEPLRVFAVWQGGFAWEGAAIGVGLASLWLLRSRKLLIGAVIALAAGLFAWHLVWRLTSNSVATPLPEVSLHDMAGERLALTRFRGRPLVINLWASWCPPCLREMPMMAKVAAEAPGATLVFVNSGESAAAIARYMARQNFTLPNVLRDAHQQVAQHYGMPGLPVTLFIDADGRLRSAHVGEISREVLLGGIQRLTR